MLEDFCFKVCNCVSCNQWFVLIEGLECRWYCLLADIWPVIYSQQFLSTASRGEESIGRLDNVGICVWMFRSLVQARSLAVWSCLQCVYSSSHRLSVFSCSVPSRDSTSSLHFHRWAKNISLTCNSLDCHKQQNTWTNGYHTTRAAWNGLIRSKAWWENCDCKLHLIIWTYGHRLACMRTACWLIILHIMGGPQMKVKTTLLCTNNNNNRRTSTIMLNFCRVIRL